jgi:hypothetical protein
LGFAEIMELLWKLGSVGKNEMEAKMDAKMDASLIT